MVWGDRDDRAAADGSSRRGREVALELHAKHQAAVRGPRPAAADERRRASRYMLMTSVARALDPVHPRARAGDNREIQLQRAAMPRLLNGTEGVTPDKIRPRTRLVREGLDDELAVPYYVAEEEVERAGTIVRRAGSAAGGATAAS